LALNKKLLTQIFFYNVFLSSQKSSRPHRVFDDKKLENLQFKKSNYLIKMQYFYSQASMIGFPAPGETYSPQREHSELQKKSGGTVVLLLLL
jgi:hypothetical protein